MGRLVVILGAGLLLLGLLVWALERGGAGGWRLPGDFNWSGRGWRVQIPLATSILISVALTVIVNLALWLMRRR
jgi:hypothetical protein